jgi:sugar O-acyltransferase (sialic acid O-acetyltransferase NeuD family)
MTAGVPQGLIEQTGVPCESIASVPKTGAGIVICGAGGHGRVVAEIAEQIGECRVAGFVDDDPMLQGRCVQGYPVLGDRSILGTLRARGITKCVMGIGDNADRCRVAAIIEGMGWELVTVVHPSAQVSTSAAIGCGSVIEAGAVVKAGASVGRLAIINSCVSVGHDVVLGEGVQLSPGASIGGFVRIGDGSQIGMNASVIPGVQIGSNVVVGANAAVIRDLPSNVVAVGVPASIVRHNSQGGSLTEPESP